MSSTYLPTGTVTLLAVDAIPAAPVTDRRLPALVHAHHGVCVAAERRGAYVVAFARAGEAVACAVDLHAAVTPPDRLRIGIHSGQVRPGVPDGDFGPTMLRAISLRDMAVGGQIVLSSATTDLVGESLPAGTRLTGLHRPAASAHSEPVWQLCVHGGAPRNATPAPTESRITPRWMTRC